MVVKSITKKRGNYSDFFLMRFIFEGDLENAVVPKGRSIFLCHKRDRGWCGLNSYLYFRSNWKLASPFKHWRELVTLPCGSGGQILCATQSVLQKVLGTSTAVCICERETETERQREMERQREGQRERLEREKVCGWGRSNKMVRTQALT